MSAAWWPRPGCLVAVALSLAAAPTADADAATLRVDASFGDDGIARVPLRPGGIRTLVRPLRPLRQPDGKVLVAAAIEGDRGDPMQVAIARFKRNGEPDATFGRRGLLRVGAHWNFDPHAVAVQPDGRIVLMGAAGRGINSLYSLVAPAQIGLIRLLPDGSRDHAFGTDGFVAWNPPWRDDTRLMQTIPGLLLRQADGRLLVAASVDELRKSDPFNLDVQRVAFVRFNETGALDESFGRAGAVEGPDGANVPAAWAALPDGRMVAAAPRNGGFGPPVFWSLDVFTADGTVDREFGQDGSVRIEGSTLFGIAALVAAGDGTLVVIATDRRSAGTVLRRILPGGQLDAGFGTACGRPLRDFSWGGGAATPHGGVFVAASTFVIRGHQHSVFARYGPHGCVAGRPLRVRAVSAGPPLLRGRHMALVGATDAHGLALIRIRL
jgi:uncharacterized delta-60 repeat protein